jgi:hypothetical protein
MHRHARLATAAAAAAALAGAAHLVGYSSGQAAPTAPPPLFRAAAAQARGGDPDEKSAAIIRALPAPSAPLTKNNSRPFGCHAGLEPPSSETSIGAAASGCGRTYTSDRPEPAFEQYASQWPSGENAGQRSTHAGVWVRA